MTIRCFTDRPKGLEYGSRSRAGCTSWDFEDSGACLCRYSVDLGTRSVSDSGYVSTLSPMGKGVI